MGPVEGGGQLLPVPALHTVATLTTWLHVKQRKRLQKMFCFIYVDDDDA